MSDRLVTERELEGILRKLQALETRQEREKSEVPIPNIGARIYHNAVQSINNTTNTALAFNSKDYDTASFHDNTTNNTRLTIPYTGKYSISASIDFAVHATGERGVYFRVNGATYIAGNVGSGSGTINTTVALEAKYNFVTGDYVECIVFQNSGGALNVNRQTDYSPIFAIQRLP